MLSGRDGLAAEPAAVNPEVLPLALLAVAVVDGGRVVRAGTKVLVNDRRGRPRLANPKQAVKLRIDHDVLQHFRANVPAVLAEEGCIEYGAAIDATPAPAFQTPCGPDTFVVIEKWESMDHLKAHGAAPHMKAYAEKNKDLLASRAVHVLQNA